MEIIFTQRRYIYIYISSIGSWPTLQPQPLRRSTASQKSRSLRASPTAWLMSVADDSSRRTDCSTDASPSAV